MRNISRREFFQICAAISAGSILTSASKSKDYKDTRGKIVLVKNKGEQINKERYSALLHKGITKLLNEEDAVGAWSSLFTPEDRVGIKVNCLASPKLSPHPELIEAIVEGLKWAGVAEENILIWDRSNKELEKGNFKINTSSKGVKCFGTDAIEGGGFEQELTITGSVATCFSMILTRFCTALINVAVMKDHDLAGVGVAMKNLYGCIHNPNKYHDNNCSPYLADVCNHSYIKDKMRLVICDAIVAQYNGGPAFKPQWTWKFNSILISQDAVALDTIAYNIIDNKRKKMGLLPLKEDKREPQWLKVAEQYGLGINDISKINLIELEG